jgi:hypothetical protein
VTLTKAPASAGTGALSGAGPIDPDTTTGKATFSSLMVVPDSNADSPLGDYVLTATSGSLTATSNKFTIYDGTLNCNPNPPFSFSDPAVTVTDSTQSGYAEGNRGYWNKDGLACEPILYTFTNTILTDNTVHLAWDTSTQQLPAFTYTMTWKTEDVANPSNSADSSTYGWPVPKRPYVAWQASDGTVSTANFVPALTCMSTDLPAPYAALDSATPITATQTSFTIDVPPTVPTSYPTATLPPPGDASTTPPLTPFPVVIGKERMQVVGVTAAGGGQYTLTVVRGDGGTTPAPHSSGAYVMSTPLPIDPDPSSPYHDTQVPMCVVNHGWMAAGIDPTNGIPQVRYFTTVYDIGDGFVTIR